MNESPYSPDAREAQEVAADQACLDAAYDRGLRGIESQTAHQQNQALIAELHTRGQRRAAGETQLGPIRTRLEAPTPAPAPQAAAPTLSPMRIVVDGEEHPNAPVLEPLRDPGARQMEGEQAALARALDLAAAMRRHGHAVTADEWAVVHAIQARFAERQRERAAHGVTYLQPWMARPMLTLKDDQD